MPNSSQESHRTPTNNSDAACYRYTEVEQLNKDLASGLIQISYYYCENLQISKERSLQLFNVQQSTAFLYIKNEQMEPKI